MYCKEGSLVRILANHLIFNNGENFEIVESFRIGVRKDLKKPLRFYIKNNKYVSRKK